MEIHLVQQQQHATPDSDPASPTTSCKCAWAASTRRRADAVGGSAWPVDAYLSGELSIVTYLLQRAFSNVSVENVAFFLQLYY